MRLLLIRHARTAANAEGRSQGRTDHPLDELGLRQAEALAELVIAHEPDALVSSPALRARSTAAPIAAATGLEVAIDERLHEVDQGDLDGLTGVEMRARAPEFMERWAGDDIEALRIPGGETLGEAQARMVAVLEALAAGAAEDATVAVVSHNLALRTYLCHVLGVPLAHFRRLRTDLASLSVVEVTSEGTHLEALNERCHVEHVEAAAPD